MCGIIATVVCEFNLLRRRFRFVGHPAARCFPPDWVCRRFVLMRRYLTEFGCRADERWEFRELFASVAESGDLSLYSAAQLAHTFHGQRAAMKAIVEL
jgi:hypothetical protein